MKRHGIDFARRMGEAVIMRLVRCLFCLLMVLAVLPWGAYAASFPKPGGHGTVGNQPASRIEAAAEERAALGAFQPAGLSVKKKCRTATLPGSPCGPDLILPPAAATPPDAPRAAARPDAPDRSAHGLSHPPPGGPPRAF